MSADRDKQVQVLAMLLKHLFTPRGLVTAVFLGAAVVAFLLLIPPEDRSVTLSTSVSLVTGMVLFMRAYQRAVSEKRHEAIRKDRDQLDNFNTVMVEGIEKLKESNPKAALRLTKEFIEPTVEASPAAADFKRHVENVKNKLTQRLKERNG